MFLSHLLISVGQDPDRPRPGRLWLRNLYHVHQRLCMAFPSQSRKNDDPEFLAPFDPADFGGKQVGVERSEDAGFLFRIDPQPGGRAVILVQSAFEPNWDYAFQNAGYLLAARPCKGKQFDPLRRNGEQLRFRVRANLSKKIKRSADGTDLTKSRPGTDKFGRPKMQGKRVSLTWDKDQDPQDVIREWFVAGGKRGFAVNTFRATQIGWGRGARPGTGREAREGNPSGHRLMFRSALLEGTLTVTDANKFKDILIRGIGSGKAFGFGLLSVTPVPKP